VHIGVFIAAAVSDTNVGQGIRLWSAVVDVTLWRLGVLTAATSAVTMREAAANCHAVRKAALLMVGSDHFRLQPPLLLLLLLLFIYAVAVADITAPTRFIPTKAVRTSHACIITPGLLWQGLVHTSTVLAADRGWETSCGGLLTGGVSRWLIWHNKGTVGWKMMLWQWLGILVSSVASWQHFSCCCFLKWCRGVMLAAAAAAANICIASAAGACGGCKCAAD